MGKKKGAINRVQFIMMEKDINVFKLSDMLLQRTPIIVNFEDFKENESNKIITFLSGVTYAIDGEIEMIKEKIFLFACKDDFKDGSLRKFVEEYKE